ncbi:glycosyltransferase [Xylanimonas ulmi]|uniref:Glycosyltransferase involved in cell wall biosynthesis n=1 Tax=Xylanimonas ulmi TaxID=228973 RepID=A0A4Q7M4V7_9MICO|nr:glycosyltransferase [Xylanibacterium ulmi]RZS62986.1 glycosyltransferase involved in cell wall biosynthesis [Xylanibacterium ulmi]
MTLSQSPRALRVLSLYEGFFAGGARQLHTTVVAGLHTSGRQRHAALSIHAEVRREATLQRMADDQRYQRLLAAGVRVSTLGRATDDGLDPSVFTAAELERAAAEVRASDVVMSLKEQPLRLVNQLARLDRPVVACLHRSDPEHQGPALDDLLVAAGAGRLAAVVCCAESTRDAYRAAGVPASLLRVVPNGINLARFRPVSGARRLALRGAEGIGADATVVVFAARFDTMKNPGLFIAAARQFLDRDPSGHVLMCGAGMSSANPDLVAELDLAFGDHPDLLARVHPLGVRTDMERVFAASDVVALTSVFGEAAPLCLIEGAMCGAIPVTTPVGDSARIVEGIGFVTGFDPVEIAEAWIQAAACRAELRPALSRVRPRFSHVRMLSGYSSVLDRAASLARV